MQLSEHFKLSEFTRSATAERLHIDNTPGAEHIQNLTALCENILEPLRRFIDQPLIISSGYRCPKLNKAVGGVRNSQHMSGQAADISAPTRDAKGNPLSPSLSLSLLRQWMEYISHNLQFDQVIMEHHKDSKGHITHWIHVSYSLTHNRNNVIANIWKK